MSHVPHLAQLAIESARRGDIQQALVLAKQALDGRPFDHALMLFVGMLHSRRLELDTALSYVRQAVALAPADSTAHVELIRLLIGTGKLDEAEHELAQIRIPGPEPIRLNAMILARRGQPGQAAQLFQQVVAAEPRDHESWDNLGNSLLASGRPRLAAEAFAQAIELRPDLPKFREKWVEAQVEAGQGEQALEQLRQLAAENPNAVELQVIIARLQDLLYRPEEAIDALQKAIAAHPRHLPALKAFAGLLERQNRIDEFEQAIERIDQLEPDAPELHLLRARLAFRRRDFELALALTEGVPEFLDPGARADLIGRIHDRMGNSEAAFRAFEAMNRACDLSERVVARRAQALRDLIDQRSRIVGEWPRGGSSVGEKPDVPKPAFLIGFPRSGTTLLDTFLMGHPQLCIAEEKPMLQAVTEQLGGYDRIASLDEAELQSLKDLYFETAATYVPDLGDRLLINKVPFGTIDAALFHRLFPAAKIIFAMRHPFDVVLSCFITKFEPTTTLISFQTLEDAARLYDKVMTFWTQFRAATPLDVHEIKYEELVADPEQQLRQLVSFLGLQWDDDVLRHEKSAESRSFISTASYAQVIEPLYDRSIGRWKRYREQLKPVLPLLEPWAVKFGYEI